MNQSKIYLLYCKTCKSKTEHSIYHLSKLKGVKLHCLFCGTKKFKYHNLKKLEKYENE